MIIDDAIMSFIDLAKGPVDVNTLRSVFKAHLQEESDKHYLPYGEQVKAAYALFQTWYDQGLEKPLPKTPAEIAQWVGSYRIGCLYATALRHAHEHKG